MSKSTSVDHDDCIRDDEREYVCPNGCKCDCHGSNGLGTARYRLGDVVAVGGFPTYGRVICVDKFGDVTVRFIHEVGCGDRLRLVRRYVGDDAK